MTTDIRRGRLQGRTALVTGSAKRIGRAVAEALARDGARLVLHYNRSRQSAEDLAGMIRGLGSDAVVLGAALDRPGAAAALMDAAVEEMGEVDILVNNAAVFDAGDLLHTSEDLWRRELEINLTAPFLLSRSFARHRSGRHGVIVNFLDWRAFGTDPGHLAYAVSKSALAALTRNLARDLAPTIRVNGIAPGAILPPPGSDRDDAILADYPIPEWGDLQSVTETVLFLIAGPGLITGDVVFLDGGRHLV